MTALQLLALSIFALPTVAALYLTAKVWKGVVLPSRILSRHTA